MKNKIFYLTLGFAMISLSILAQVGIGTSSPNPSAALHINSVNGGFLPPVLTKTQRDNISSPAQGLMVYCSDCTTPAYYFYENGQWERVGLENNISSDTTLSSNTHDSIPSVKAVKTYVDNASGLVAVGTRNYHGNALANLKFLSTGTDNIALGSEALYSVSTGKNNLAFGTGSLLTLFHGEHNIAIGNDALEGINGDNNIGIGSYAGHGLSSSSEDNVIIGIDAAREYYSSTRNGNVFIGKSAGKNADITGSVLLGYNAGLNAYLNNVLYIENSGSDVALIGGNFANNRVGINMDIWDLNSGATFQVGGDASKSTSGSWSANSDKRLKTKIAYMESEKILHKMLQLKGATYEWNDTVTGIPRPDGIQYGFIAQDIEKVWPSKISKDGHGYLITAYGDYDPMFVESIRALNNKIKKLERENKALKVQEKSEVSELKAEMKELRSSLESLKKLMLVKDNQTTHVSR